jgi:hypothetical protein
MHVWAGPLHIPYVPRPRDRETHQCTLRNDFTVAIGMFRGPIEMGAGDGLAVMRRSR